jgi:hypothetical protein
MLAKRVLRGMCDTSCCLSFTATRREGCGNEKIQERDKEGFAMPFDPVDTSPPLTFEGEMKVTVLDPDLDPNNVLDYDLPFHLDWEITLTGTVPSFLFGSFQVEAYAESVGPGPEVSLGPQSSQANGGLVYTGRITVPAQTLDHAGLGVPPASGVYQLVVTAFYTNPNGTRTVISGYQTGTIIKVRQP